MFHRKRQPPLTRCGVRGFDQRQVFRGDGMAGVQLEDMLKDCLSRVQRIEFIKAFAQNQQRRNVPLFSQPPAAL